jgi:ABC-2 type transport system permease protein
MITLIKKDLKLIVNIKRLVLTLITFVFILGLFSAMFSNFMTEKRLIDKMQVGIVDKENSILTGMLVENFTSNEEFSSLFEIVLDDEEDLQDKFNNNDLSAIIYIPETFTESLLHFENTPLRMTLNSNYALQNTVLKNIMTSYSTYIKSVDVAIYSLYNSLKNEGLEPSTLNDINEKFSVNMVVTALNRGRIFEHEAINTFPSATSTHYFLFAIMILIIIFSASTGASLLSDEITNGCLQRYLMTGRSFIRFSLSKVVALYINMMMLILPFIVIVKLLNEAIELISLFIFFVFISLIMLFFTVLSLTIGIIFNRKGLNSLFSTLLTLILGIIGGNFIPIQLMPKVIQDLSSLTPNYWMLRTCLFINNNQISKEVLLTSLIVTLSTCFFFSLQSYLIRKETVWVK